MVAKYVTVGLKMQQLMRCSCFRHDFLVKRQKTEIRGFRASRFAEIARGPVSVNVRNLELLI